MSKWEQEPKHHYKEAPWALFDLLCLFPLKSQLSKTFFFLVGNSFTWAISAVSNSNPAYLAFSGFVIGGDSSLLVKHGPAHQRKLMVMPLQSDTRCPVCWFSRCGEGGVKGKKEWCRKGQNCLRAAAKISSAQLCDRGKALSEQSRQTFRCKNKTQIHKWEVWFQLTIRGLQ